MVKEPTWVEKIFGEEKHQLDKSRRITVNFLLVAFSSFIAQGAYDEGFWNGVRFFLYDIGEDAGSVAQLNMYSWIPWIPKVVYAAFSDMVPLCGYKRKLYIFFGSIITGVAVGLAGWHGTTFRLQAIYMLLGCLASAWANVAVDAMVVERSRDKDALIAARLQAFTKCAYGLGMVISDVVFGFIIDWYHPRVCYYIFAAFQLATAFLALILEEEKSIVNTKEVFRKTTMVWRTLNHPKILFPVLVLVALLAMPIASEPLRMYFVEELHFSATFLGIMDAVCTLCGGIGLVIFAATLANTPMQSVFLWSTLGVIACNLWLVLLVTGISREMGIHDKVFAFSDKMVNNVISAICSNAIYTYAACVCPKGIEGMAFAAMTGLFNLGGAVSALMSTWLIDKFDIHCDEDEHGKLSNCRFDGLWKLVTLTALSNLIPLIFVVYVPSDPPRVFEDINSPFKSLADVTDFDDHLEGEGSALCVSSDSNMLSRALGLKGVNSPEDSRFFREDSSDDRMPLLQAVGGN
eukprot:CAMPEP_0167768058 /NCGR_PEP_ID=MMETSP0110_2-20121227/16424_1 /TAXON_ID=629695 /ORGANISM="Gymnochlora sp., Strain CCMP2014" /LENGTH=518 /DNA_ID=CAMNT_0007656625 /DNA_START=78 /DNA_END=1634 /DNA_ORIENTATION=-